MRDMGSEVLRPELQRYLQSLSSLVIGSERQTWLVEVVRDGAVHINSARNPKKIIGQIAGLSYTPPSKEMVVETLRKLERADEKKIGKEFDRLSKQAQAAGSYDFKGLERA